MIICLLRRLGQSLLAVIAMAVLVFLGVYFIGNPVDVLINPEATQAEIAATTERLGLDKPLYRQFGILLGKPSKENPEGVERHGLKKCAEFRKQFTMRIGTIFEESHIPLHKWLQAIHLKVSSKKGFSRHQLHHVLEITHKSAWFMSHRISEAMRSDGAVNFGNGGGVVEVDETFIGTKQSRS